MWRAVGHGGGVVADGLTLALAPRLSSAFSTAVRSRSRGQPLPLPAITRLDPARPLPSHLSRQDVSSAASKERAVRLAEFEVALQAGAAEPVWEAYASFVHGAQSDELSIGRALTPHDCEQILRILSNHATRRRQDSHRLLTVLSDVRNRRRRAVWAAQEALNEHDSLRFTRLRRELDEWDAVISPDILNSAMGYIGLSLRRANLAQIDSILDHLLEAKREGDEITSLDQMHANVQPRAWSAAQILKTSVLGMTIPNLLIRKRTPRPPYPDLTSYNILLEVVTHLIHRRTPDADSDAMSTEGGDQTEQVPIELSGLRRQSQYARTAEKMRQLDFTAEVGPITLKRADALFHAVLHRMRKKSGLEPDRVTYNIMLTMYSQLGRQDLVHAVIDTLRKKQWLSSQSINNVLWSWVTQHAESDDQRAEAVNNALEVYGVLRDNLARQEKKTPYPNLDNMCAEHSVISRNKAVRSMFGLDSLAVQLVPDTVTCALMIRLLALIGKFDDALSVFKDLVSTPQNASLEPRQPSLAIFDSFFRGFSHFGRPSQLLRYNYMDPERSDWMVAEPATSQAERWNMDTFRAIFDAFLRFQPDDTAMREAGRTLMPDSESFAWLENMDGPHVMTSYGSLSMSEARTLNLLRQAPSSNQLFWIITALRRVSGDDARWTLAMWQRVHDKFNNKDSGSVFSWIGYNIDNRMQRILDYLQTRMDEANTGA